MSKKKKNYLMIGVLIPVIIAAALVIVFSSAKEKPFTDVKGVSILDNRGESLVFAKTMEDILSEDYWAYLEVALTEASQLLAKEYACSEQEALEQMLAEGYTIRTAFQPEAFAALQASVTEEKLEYGLALTDLQGNLLAVHSSPTGNYVTDRASPYSTFKPLSVYAPAVEQGVANWSKMYSDSPYKQLEDADGQKQDWPTNDSKTYSYENVPVCTAIAKSLNTIAVHCLKDLGVTASMDFLKTNFQIPLAEETYVVENYSEEEVIGNIALGYLETGVTPIEMAGYYQIFANGGSYLAPQAVTQIIDGKGETVYLRRDKSKQVLSPATADVMNKLLQEVVSAKGTGAAAKCADIQVAGKTGTGDDYTDNWFVGVTPSYSLAVWHGASPSNTAAKIFSQAVKGLYKDKPNANRQFVTHQNLNQVIYCAHSGQGIGDDCTQIEMGYYSQSQLPICEACKKNGNTEVDHNE